MLKTIEINNWLKDYKHLPLLDARSEGEFDWGHIPGAISFPILNNEERKLVGTCYKKEGHDPAVLLGYKLTGPKFHLYIQRAWKEIPKGPIVVQCWRGGLRSRILGELLSTAGYQVFQLKGGYKAYRNAVLDYLNQSFNFKVLTGYTGSGKSELLEQMEQEGKQVLHLERIANHRGSAFGALGLGEQPNQELFENHLFETLFRFDPKEPIWTEDESRKIGKLVLPLGLFESIRAGDFTFMNVPFENRVKNIIRIYGQFNSDLLIAATLKLKKRMGDLENNRAIEFLVQTDIENWAIAMLLHYDKQYKYSLSLRPNLQHFVA
jgi:tRNA 2-selenouridine synthase